MYTSYTITKTPKLGRKNTETYWEKQITSSYNHSMPILIKENVLLLEVVKKFSYCNIKERGRER